MFLIDLVDGDLEAPVELVEEERGPTRESVSITEMEACLENGNSFNR